MKKTKLIIAGIVFLTIAVAGVFVAQRLGVFSSYDATVSTKDKFSSMQKWISPDADVWFAADIWQLLKTPSLGASLGTYLMERHGLASDLVESALMGDGGVGMLGVMANLQNADAKPVAAIVVQGNFDGGKLAASVKGMIGNEGGEVVEEKIGDKVVYFEKSEDPFGFMFLDSNHMAIGSKSSLQEFFSAPAGKAIDLGEKPLPLAFGRVTISDRIRPLLPPELSEVSGITLASDDGSAVTASVNCKSADSASSIRMFLEGMRSLMMMHNKGLPLESMLERIKVSSDGQDVYVTALLADLFGIR